MPHLCFLTAYVFLNTIRFVQINNHHSFVLKIPSPRILGVCNLCFYLKDMHHKDLLAKGPTQAFQIRLKSRQLKRFIPIYFKSWNMSKSWNITGKLNIYTNSVLALLLKELRVFPLSCRPSVLQFWDPLLNTVHMIELLLIFLQFVQWKNANTPGCFHLQDVAISTLYSLPL